MGALEAVAPSGIRLTVPVLGVVVDAEGEVWHVVEKPLAAGTAVTGRVDAV
jgi:alanyl-tRNA synthetase